MANDELILYKNWLNCGIKQGKVQDKKFVQESFADTIQNSLAYQEDALVNGKPHPIVATRKDTRKCDVAVIPGDELHIGDLIKVFNDYWICVELYIDEYGMSYGELWLCNHVFCYQDFDLNIIRKYAILDDGSYSKGNDKAIAVTNNSYNCYISLDKESQAIYIDKRLGLSVIYDSAAKEILEVGKVKWIDIKSKNFGEGSHLMVFGINDDQFNPEKDNIEKLICDYQEKKTEDIIPPADIEQPAIKGRLFINGRSTIKAGTGRSYTLSAINDNTGDSLEPPDAIEWLLERNINGISIKPSTASCKIIVKEDDNLIGEMILLKCVCKTGDYEEGKIEVEVT